MARHWENINNVEPYTDSEWQTVKTWMYHSHSRFYRRITGLRIVDSPAQANQHHSWLYRIVEWWFTL